jgi:hypothetical protein
MTNAKTISKALTNAISKEIRLSCIHRVLQPKGIGLRNGSLLLLSIKRAGLMTG